jgi:hypothetical protein
VAKVPLLIFSLLCGIYMNMSIKSAFTDRIMPKIKVNQAHPNNCTRNIERVDGQMRHGERPNKIPIYEKMLQAEGNRQQAIIHIF